MGLVLRFAGRYSRWHPSIDIDELIQEGRIGLWDALRGFDPRRGFRFSTYASRAIIRRMIRLVRLRRDPGELVEFTAFADPRTPAPFDRQARNDELQLDRQDARELLSRLPPEKARVLELRFGFIDGGPHRLRQIARKLGRTPERIRQIQNAALAQLRRIA